MATIYAAKGPGGVRAAVKVMHAGLAKDPMARTRFLREARVVQALEHRGMVRIYDAGIEGALFYIAMELLQGESLEQRRERRGGRLSPDEIFRVGDALLDVLAFAHDKGVIHRDIKPENLFLVDDGTLKVLDFGLARLREPQAGETTQTGLTVGTPDFMAPEQAAGRSSEIDGRADIFSAGATLYTLSSGQTLHDGETLAEHLFRIATEPARPLLTLIPEFPREMADVIDRAVRIRREERFDDARAMQKALREAYERYEGTSTFRHGEEPEGDRSRDSATVIAGHEPVTQGDFKGHSSGEDIQFVLSGSSDESEAVPTTIYEDGEGVRARQKSFGDAPTETALPGEEESPEEEFTQHTVLLGGGRGGRAVLHAALSHSRPSQHPSVAQAPSLPVQPRPRPEILWIAIVVAGAASLLIFVVTLVLARYLLLRGRGY